MELPDSIKGTNAFNSNSIKNCPALTITFNGKKYIDNAMWYDLEYDIALAGGEKLMSKKVNGIQVGEPE